MGAPLNWGILGTGRIAGVFARGVAHSNLGRVAAVGSRNAASAEKFAAEHRIPRSHASYEALLADPAVEAVYIATPHPWHGAWIIRAAEAGRHVLCEKPLCLNRADAERAIAACRRRDVLLMEAFMYRFHPQTAKVVEIVRSGALGTVGLVQATFSFARDYAPGNSKWDRSLGGGGILDVGCYPVSFARLVAGAARGSAFADPVGVTGVAKLHPQERTDAYAAATMQFADGLIAQVACGVGLQQDNSARIYGSAGWLHVPVPWIPNREGGESMIHLHRRDVAAPEEIAIRADGWLYALEADAFAAAVARGDREVPEMTPADTLGNLAALDAWRAAAGVVYPGEEPGR